MTVQPVIENAVKHGLESLGRQGILKVYTREEGAVLKLIVEDNGNGMNEQQLMRLLASLGGNSAGASPKESGKSGIGLQNLHRRLQFMFGEGYGLQIQSIPGEGTQVAIVLPVAGEGEQTT
jgi:two-component system sensor histidine kinase YesM